MRIFGYDFRNEFGYIAATEGRGDLFLGTRQGKNEGTASEPSTPLSFRVRSLSAETAMQKPTEIQGDALNQTVNILLVDDQPANLMVLDALLGDLGQNLVKTSSGEEALRLLQEDDFALVLLDVQMHGLDGFETAKEIRGREKSRHTPIIFITAYESDHFPVDQAYLLGAVDYLVKPLVPAILRAKVSGFVELYQNSARLRQLERLEFERRLAEENTRVDRRRNARLRVTQLLAEAASLPDAAQRILEVLCECLEWDAGAIWKLDSDADVLRCVDFWHRSGVNVADFEATTRERTFGRGIGLPGRVWSSGRPAWIPDVGVDTNFPRGPIATREKLHGAFAVPIVLGQSFFGVMEFFSRQIREPDTDLLELMTTVNGQISQFIVRKQSEAQLRESERRFAGFMQYFPGLAWLKDLKGRYVYANDAAIKVFRRTWNELYGRTDDELFSPETAAQFKHNDYKAISSGTGVQVIESLEHDDGIIHHSIVNKFPIVESNGKIALVGGMALDITDRVRAETFANLLADASSALSTVVDEESALQKVAELSVPHFADWCIVDVTTPNGTLRRVAVSHSDPAKVRRCEELQTRYPSDPNTPYGTRHVLRTGRTEMAEVTDTVLQEVARDKQHLQLLRGFGWTSYLCVPLQTRQKMLGVLTFMTEGGRRFLASDLQFAEELARRASIAIENCQLYANLQEADRLKDEFLAMLAHELRNPLAPIRSALQVMKMPTAASDVQQQVREIADRQVNHMARLLDDLLDMSRISRGRIELRRELVDVALIVRRAVEGIQSLIEERNHRLTISLPAEALRLDADPTRFEQILTNLLNNAAKYTDPGGHVSVSVERDGSQIVLRVRDTGIGIEPDMLPRIFDLFVQAERRIDRSHSGIGIGLTLVRRLVEMHGGAVQAFSEGMGKGSEFVVRLPGANPASNSNATPTKKIEALDSLPSRQVLVVDDNQDAADCLSLLLKLSGQSVQKAYSGTEAIQAVQRHRPEIVFLDIGMPGLDGYEVARRIRQQPDLASIRLIALTGWGQDEDRRRTKEAGFDYHLVKPIEPGMLTKLLTEL